MNNYIYKGKNLGFPDYIYANHHYFWFRHMLRLWPANGYEDIQVKEGKLVNTYNNEFIGEIQVAFKRWAEQQLAESILLGEDNEQ